jgi:protein-tyrosine-phosphatase
MKVHSAGLRVPVDQKSPPDAVAAAEALGVDMHSHISRPLTPQLVDHYDIILAMETWHVQSMKEKYPQNSNKFFLLPLYDPSKYGNNESFLNYNIEDPYGKPEERFKESFRRIERCIEGLIKQCDVNWEKRTPQNM